MDEFTRSYIETALWSSNDESDESGGKPLDRNYGIHDIDRDTLARMRADCARFQQDHYDDISEDLRKAGHDFWLTRNRHGAGFWDGDWEKTTGRRLTNISHGYGEVHLYVGDDGKIHQSNG